MDQEVTSNDEDMIYEVVKKHPHSISEWQVMRALQISQSHAKRVATELAKKNLIFVYKSGGSRMYKLINKDQPQ